MPRSSTSCASAHHGHRGDLPSLGAICNIDALEPAPGSVELLPYLKRDGAVIGALLPYGDASFVQRIQAIARARRLQSMKTGIFLGALGTFFDFYLSYVVAAEVGVVQRWFAGGLRCSSRRPDAPS